MFYSQFILAKKGPLGTIWIAAHLERKLRKNQVADTDIGVSVDSILFPDVPIALRLSSHLLLGVVRIYSRKVNYLFDDCSEALLKIKQAFRSTAVDLPPEESTAPYHSITLPETFDLDDFELPDSEMFQGNYVDHHVSTKEQITLQDTMDGVVYSTSQFGLDERFGEGDTSQIGLDIDEELFLGNIATKGIEIEGVPDANRLAYQPMTPQEHDENCEGIPETPALMQENDGDDQNEIPAASREAFEHFQSPFTPGLECPSSLNALESLTLEAKDRDLAGSEAVECSANGNSKSDAPEMIPYSEENGHVFVDLEMKQAKSPLQSVSVTDNGLPAISPAMVERDKSIAQLPECSNGHLSAEDGPNREEDVHGRVVINNEQSAHRVDQTDVQIAESPSCSQVTTELEDPGRRTSSNDGEIHNNMGESCSTSKPLVSNIWPSESPGRPEVVNVEAQTFLEPTAKDTLNDSTHEGVTSNQIPALRPCNSLRQPDMSSPRGEGCQSTAAVEPVSEKKLLVETQDDYRNLNEAMDLSTSFDIHLNNDRSAASDLPAPEKLLSVTEGLKSNDLHVVSTPEKEVFGDNGVGVGTELISGKKRSFTESTLTVQSLNSSESFSMNKSRKTAESVPGDDDLLSSILVGRKSSVLKLKPTPPAPEIISTKRQRSAPRASASKRKVLIDDMMVLHGDTIRQQLTNTEDIRRLRKKAPCTRPEIAMIKRQFLEEEIFSEPIFTGISAALVSLHREAFDLSMIKVTDNDQENAPFGVEKGAESYVVRNDTETQQDVISIVKENSIFENPNLISQQETLPETAEMEVDGQNVEVSVVDHAVHNLESSLLPNDPAVNDFTNAPENSLQPEFVDIEPVEGSSLAGISNDEVAAIKVNENDAEVRVDPGNSNGNLQASMEPASDIDGCENMNYGDGNLFVDGIENNDLGNNPDAVQPSDLGYNEQDLTTISTPGEGATVNSSFPLDLDVTGENVAFDKGENADSQEQADVASAINAEITAKASANEFHGDFYDVMVGNDTDFLNVDDDDVAEDNEDYVPGAEDTRLLENSGWSSRTRAVSKYLQILFEKEPLQGRRVLAIDNLLMGKTRKEASRMFFETLVLKTKDYIHVEQAIPFDNINVKPRIKLMKADF